MRKLVLIFAVIALTGYGDPESAVAEQTRVKKARCVEIHRGINFYRKNTWELQRYLGRETTRASRSPIRSCAYAKWVANRWRKVYRSHLKLKRQVQTPEGAIRYVFGRYATEALAVAKCESGLSVWAQNGQYLGLFQMGDFARGAYGHSTTPLGQARAAYNYFMDSGWSPWECKPW